MGAGDPIPQPPVLPAAAKPPAAPPPDEPTRDTAVGPAAAPPPAGTDERSLTATGLGTRGTRPVTPEDVLRVDEAHRARFYAVYLTLLGPPAAAGAYLLSGPRLSRDIYVLTVAFMTLASAVTVWWLRDASRYRLRHTAFLAVTSVAAALAALYFWGPLSGALVCIPLGVFFYSSAANPYVGIGLTAVCIVAQLSLVVLQAKGLILDRGLVAATDLDLSQQLLTSVFADSILIACVVMARVTRQVTRRSILELRSAVREVAQREALLIEARQELERALQLGGLGRYSEQIVGSYRLGAVIGRGAMGEVYEAFHVETREPAAVKLLHAHLLGDAIHVRRFLRETALVAALKAPNVVQVREVADAQGPVPYLAMERLSGQTLAALLKSEAQLSLGQVVELVHQIASGLAAAHAVGIVHRDIKPQNLFRADEAGGHVWKVLDFGASKLQDHVDTLTLGQIIGTPSYMSPEQAQGKEVDDRSDLFSLGVVIYRALTGRVAFPGDTAAAMHGVVSRHPQPPSELVALPVDIDAVVAIAMAKDAGQRFPSAESLATAFAAAARGELAAAWHERARRLRGRARRSEDDREGFA